MYHLPNMLPPKQSGDLLRVTEASTSKEILKSTDFYIRIADSNDVAVFEYRGNLEYLADHIRQAILAARGTGYEQCQQDMRRLLGFREWAGKVSVER